MKKVNQSESARQIMVIDVARVTGVDFDVAMACLAEYHGFGKDMEDILMFVSERVGSKEAIAQATMLSSTDWKVQRKALMAVLGQPLWRRVQHSCGNNPHRVGVLASYLLNGK